MSVNHRDQRVYLVQLARVLLERGPSAPSAIYDEVADRVGLSAEQKRERTPSRRSKSLYGNRIQFARQSLVCAGIIISSDHPSWVHGIWALSEEGERLVRRTRKDAALKAELLRRVREGERARREARAESKALLRGEEGTLERQGEEASTQALEAAQEEESGGLEHIEALVDQANQAAFETMLAHLRRMDETAFEHLVASVLRAALRAESVEVTQQTRDGGIDGILFLDALGMRRAVFEAKRYGAENTVGRPLIDAFATAA